VDIDARELEALAFFIGKVRPMPGHQIVNGPCIPEKVERDCGELEGTATSHKENSK
jgi:hypothetical protein